MRMSPLQKSNIDVASFILGDRLTCLSGIKLVKLV